MIEESSASSMVDGMLFDIKPADLTVADFC
jgi:hypothetical protein